MAGCRVVAEVQLITYADRLAGSIRGLSRLLYGPFDGLFGGVHVLPFFEPIDGADAGFDPVDHLSVDERLGDWQDVASLSQDYSVMADMIVNHMSAKSPQFLDVEERGAESPHWPLFLKKKDVFSEHGDEAEIRKIFRPRPTSPFTAVRLQNGETHEFWTTFSAEQIDINVETPAGRAYLQSIIERLASVGIRQIRLDAAGYAIKRHGTRCFMLEDTFDFIRELAVSARAKGIQTLVEIHSHYQTQIEIAARSDLVYDFALPPLVLNALYTNNASALKKWLEISPRNCVTVLDTHDGIGIVDVAKDGNRHGLLSDEEIDQLIETIHSNTDGESRAASGFAASNLDVYQVNSTYFDALGKCEQDYLIARAIQLFAPGTPQIYYVGLLAGSNDLTLVKKTGVGRDINRHYFTQDEIDAAVKRPVVQQLFDLIRLRNEASAFGGTFHMQACPDSRIIMKWTNGDTSIELGVNLETRQAMIVERDSFREITHVIGVHQQDTKEEGRSAHMSV